MKALPDSKVTCVLLYSFSDAACDVLEDDLVLSAEEDAGECRQTSLSPHKNTAAKELNFSRLVSCSIKEPYPMGLVFRVFCLDHFKIILIKSILSDSVGFHPAGAFWASRPPTVLGSFSRAGRAPVRAPTWPLLSYTLWRNSPSTAWTWLRCSDPAGPLRKSRVLRWQKNDRFLLTFCIHTDLRARSEYRPSLAALSNSVCSKSGLHWPKWLPQWL